MLIAVPLARRAARRRGEKEEAPDALPERRCSGTICHASKSEHTAVETGIDACGDLHRPGNLPSRVDEAGIPAFFIRFRRLIRR